MEYEYINFYCEKGLLLCEEKLHKRNRKCDRVSTRKRRENNTYKKFENICEEFDNCCDESFEIIKNVETLNSHCKTQFQIIKNVENYNTFDESSFQFTDDFNILSEPSFQIIENVKPLKNIVNFSMGTVTTMTIETEATLVFSEIGSTTMKIQFNKNSVRETQFLNELQNREMTSPASNFQFFEDSDELIDIPLAARVINVNTDSREVTLLLNSLNDVEFPINTPISGIISSILE